MTAKTKLLAAVSGAFVLASTVMAQDVLFHREIKQFDEKQFTVQLSESFTTGPGKVVTGAPYSADEKSVMTQTLSDGNRIVNTNAAKLFRDQEGRTRVERSFKMPNDSAEDRTVSINDPVTSTNYVLDERNRTAMKVGVGRVSAMTLPAFVPGKVQMIKTGPGPQANTEDLGTQVMEGLSVQGTRSKVVIPVGEMGNERPIEIVSERWYSPDLQMVIMSKRNDPRMGETVYTVTNINRSNPDPSLFQVPAGYTESTNQQPHTMIKRLERRDE